MFTDTLTRSTGPVYESVALTHTWGACPAVSGWGSASVNAFAGVTESWKYGEAIANFRRRRAAGELLPHTSFKKLVHSAAVTASYTTMKAKKAAWNVCSQSSGMDPAWSLLTVDHLLEVTQPNFDLGVYAQQAAAAIDSNSFDLLTFAAEARELRKLYDFVSGRWLKAELAKAAAKKNPLRRNQKLADTFVDSWLGVRYGIRPLIADINNLNDALKKNLGKLRRFSERRGSGSSWTTTDELGSIGTGWGQPISWPARRITSVSQSWRGSVTADIDLGTFKLNPLQTGWELIPYSFVADWFVSVGKTLGAINLALFAKGYQASIGFKTEIDVKYEMYGSPTASDGWSLVTTPTPLAIEQRVEYEERAPTRVSLTPFFNVRLDPWKAFDLYALLDQLARKLR